MSVDVSMELFGVRDALAELRRIDPKLRAAAVKKVKAAGAPLAAAAAENYPPKVDLRGWQSTGRLGYSGSKARSGVKVQVGGRTPRGANRYPIVTLVQGNAGAALYDIAGLRGGTKARRGPGRRPNFVPLMDSVYGNAQRGMWRSRRRIDAEATAALRNALDEVAGEVNRKLV